VVQDDVRSIKQAQATLHQLASAVGRADRVGRPTEPTEA
jgi:hypothetical protein